ncbi:MAG: methyltransferase [Cellvibrionaceae bacterium]|nr:methyltransferase [Cellvibrionaceae bacterium]
MSADTLLQLGQQSWQLQRYPAQANDPLRAWDAADEYILQHIQDKIEAGQSLLILNDSFGALATALAQYRPHCLTDSYLSQQACRANLQNNLQTHGIEPTQVYIDNDLTWPEQQFDWVLIKIPKSHALLDEQLRRAKALLKPKGKVVAGIMAKYLQRSTVEIFNNCIGPAHSSLAQKKARLVLADNNGEAPAEPELSALKLPELSLHLVSHAGVFAQGKLDIGSRFMLEHLPSRGDYQNIIDLGCGNGLLGIRAAQLYPNANISFYDESYRALDSARINCEHNLQHKGELAFTHTDCLEGAKPNSADLILNNPPFHQQQTVGDHIARRMFSQSKRVLKPGGEFWLVGNRHLGYHQRLKKLFGNCTRVAGNSKFVVLKALKN